MSADPSARIGIAILAKAPLPGLAKTRLIPCLGADGAAALQRWLLQRAVATAIVADVGPVTLWCAPDTRHPEFAVAGAFGPVARRRQPAGDLGARMLAALAEPPAIADIATMASAAASPAVAGTLLIGTDCPVLTPGRLRRAAERLRTHEATVIPAEDGGYVLIGARRPEPRLFADVDWGSDRVMAQTRARLAALAWRWHEDAPLWDVDRPEDFARLCARFPGAFALPAGIGIAA